MRKSGFGEEQIIAVLKEAQAGLPVMEVCRKYGISEATFSAWRSKYGGLEVSEAKRLAEQMLDVATLHERLGKNF